MYDLLYADSPDPFGSREHGLVRFPNTDLQGIPAIARPSHKAPCKDIPGGMRHWEYAPLREELRWILDEEGLMLEVKGFSIRSRLFVDGKS